MVALPDLIGLPCLYFLLTLSNVDDIIINMSTLCSPCSGRKHSGAAKPVLDDSLIQSHTCEMLSSYQNV